MTITKGTTTRNTILAHAGKLATEIGLEGVTIGRLAEDLDLSKSGLFAHFRSKEELQMQTLEYQRQRFVDVVVKPMLEAPAGAERVQALFDRWLAWRTQQPGGCFFAAASFELDDRPGPVRDRLAELQREWIRSITLVAQSAIKRGHFRADIDPELWAHEFYGMMLSYHLAERLLRDPGATPRVHRSFEQLVARSRASAAA